MLTMAQREALVDVLLNKDIEIKRIYYWARPDQTEVLVKWRPTTATNPDYWNSANIDRYGIITERVRKVVQF